MTIAITSVSPSARVVAGSAAGRAPPSWRSQTTASHDENERQRALHLVVSFRVTTRDSTSDTIGAGDDDGEEQRAVDRVSVEARRVQRQRDAHHPRSQQQHAGVTRNARDPHAAQPSGEQFPDGPQGDVGDDQHQPSRRRAEARPGDAEQQGDERMLQVAKVALETDARDGVEAPEDNPGHQAGEELGQLQVGRRAGEQENRADHEHALLVLRRGL